MHAKLEAAVRRVVALAVSLAAALCVSATPAHAAIAADFNGDGVLDAVVLPRPPETNIIIHLSGSAPQILKLSGRIISVVAADVDHDGNLDLSALSEHRGLHVWLNKAGHGRFADAPRAGPVFEAPRGGHTVPTLLFTSPTDLGKSTAPRGPPSSTLD